MCGVLNKKGGVISPTLLFSSTVVVFVNCWLTTNIYEYILADFDDRLWFSLVDYATVYGAEYVRFTFKDGTEIRA